MKENTPVSAQEESGLATAASEPPVPTGEKLDRALARGLAWVGVARWGTQILTWFATMVIARQLNQADYGIWTSAGVYLGVVALISEFGIGASIVMIRDLDRKQIAQVGGLSVITGVIAAALSVAVAPLIGAFYRTPAIGAVIMVMSSVFIISSFRVVPLALLQRDLRFRELAIVDMVRSALQSGVLVTLAYITQNYWSFTFGAIVAESAWTVMILSLRRHAIALPRFRDIRRAISLSADIMIGRLSWYGYSNADFAVAGRRLGPVATGDYGMAWSIASVPVEKVNSVIMSVTPTFLAAVQHSNAELRRYLLTLTGAISLAALPAGIGLALVADDFTHVVLTSKWEGAIPAIQLLAVYSAVRAVGPILTPVLNVTGQSRFAMWNSIFALAILPAAFLVGSRWGITGIAAAWVIAHPIVLIQAYRRVAKRIELSTRDYLRAVWPALHSVAGLAGAVILTRLALNHVSLSTRLPFEVLAGVAGYGGFLFLFHRQHLDMVRRAIKLAGGGRS
jgi:PST family polysaccharide transporter